MLCFECDQPADHQHHVIPKSRGGTKTVPLCHRCHGLAHNVSMASPVLIREGMEKARAGGVKIGRPFVRQEIIDKVIEMRTTGVAIGLCRIADSIGISSRTANRIVREWELEQGD